jgi:hypothetical protein
MMPPENLVLLSRNELLTVIAALQAEIEWLTHDTKLQAAPFSEAWRSEVVEV